MLIMTLLDKIKNKNLDYISTTRIQKIIMRIEEIKKISNLKIIIIAIKIKSKAMYILQYKKFDNACIYISV